MINAARGENDIVVTSIFVNPSQFGPTEDFERYPVIWRPDSAACELAGVDVIFAPDAQEMSRGLHHLRRAWSYWPAFMRE